MVDIVGKEWFDMIGGEFDMDYMHELSSFVLNDRKTHTVYPENTESIFSVFRNLQPSNIKVVIIGQDPYHCGAYDGKAFSNHKDKLNISPSLRNILKEVESDVYNGFKLKQSPDLTRWQDQGVFLINRVLTVRKGQPDSHSGMGWEIFTAACLDKLSKHKDNIVFMLWGVKARTVKDIIRLDTHLILESGHPSPMAANRGLWYGNKHFTSCNKFLENKGIKTIDW